MPCGATVEDTRGINATTLLIPLPSVAPSSRFDDIARTGMPRTCCGMESMKTPSAEKRGEEVGHRLYIVAIGSLGSGGGALKGRVTRADLVGRSEVLHSFSTVPGPGDQIIRTGDTILTEESATALRSTLLGGATRLLMGTDLPDVANLDLPLPLQVDGAWERANCSRPSSRSSF